LLEERKKAGEIHHYQFEAMALKLAKLTTYTPDFFIINADGSLASVRVIKSAGNPILDQAALEMVKMAAPFSAFPPDLAEQASSLEIRRKWFFAPEGSVSVQ
jgi:TonB family protein